ncbi:MAG: hypothetical protein ABI417_04160 [Coleofasciculaceae cyanobacterium]
MARGGKREGTGGQFKWKHGKTKTIRVPESLAEQILEIAKRLDEGISIIDHDTSSKVLDKSPKIADGGISIIDHDTSSKVLDLSGISMRQHNGILAVYLEDLAHAGYQILPERVSQLVEARMQKLLIDKRLKNGNNSQR